MSPSLDCRAEHSAVAMAAAPTSTSAAGSAMTVGCDKTCRTHSLSTKAASGSELYLPRCCLGVHSKSTSKTTQTLCTRWKTASLSADTIPRGLTIVTWGDSGSACLGVFQRHAASCFDAHVELPRAARHDRRETVWREFLHVVPNTATCRVVTRRPVC